MPIQAQAADGTLHEFPDGTAPAIVDKAMKTYAMQGGGPGKPGKVPEQDIGAGGSFMAGMGDPLAGGSQLIAHIAKSPEEAAKVDASVKQREAGLQAGGVNPLMRGLGEAVTGAPLMAAGPAGIAGAAVGGAGAGLLQPDAGGPGQGDYISQKTHDVMLGAAFGGGAGAVGKAIGAGLSPVLGTAQNALIQSGVNLTPGQMAGGVMRRAEEAMKSIPILGSFIRGAEGRGIEGFNKAVLNQALEPIGQKLDPKVAVGHDAIAAAQKKIGDAYDTLLPTLKLSLDQDLTNDISNVRFAATELPKPQQDQFNAILTNRLAPFFQRSPMPGRQGPTLKETESALRNIADSYRGSGDPAQRNMARLLDDTRGALRDALERQNPGAAVDLKKIDSAYAMFARAQGAAARRTGSEGVFTPNDLLATIKSQDKSVRKGSFARGDALMQTYAEFGQSVLPGKMPDSGTPERYLWDTALLALGGGAAHETGTVIPAAAGVGAGSMMYTRPGIAALNALARPGPVKGAIGKAAPYAAIGATPQALQDRDYGNYQ